MAETSVLDADRIATLRELDDGDGTLLPLLADEYGRDATHQVEAMRAALAAGDAPALRHSAHSLKGASANLGAPAMAERCLDLERAARDGHLDGVASQIDDIEAELGRVREALRRVAAGG
ncbi:MAG TPA: Hpt domain-containing protein [Acidimicrobiia bacterium]|nr:Hpt domain-containing protein [Acidimicrobiia bacterium]